MTPTSTNVLEPHIVHEMIERRHRERIEADRRARYRSLLLFLVKYEEGPVRETLAVDHAAC